MNRSKRNNQKARKLRGNKPPNKNGKKLVTGTKPSSTSLSRISENFMPLFPAKVTKVLRYQEYVDLTSTSGTLNTYIFSANGLWDPNQTGTGHSPMGFDQMMIFFEHYSVKYAKIHVNFNNAAAGCMSAGIRMDPNNSGLSDIQRMLEFGGITWDVYEAKNTIGCTKTLALGCNIMKIQGVSPTALTADTSLRGDVSNNPTEQTFFHLVAWDPSSLSGTFKCNVIIEYTAVFTEPRVATLSTEQVHALMEKNPRGCKRKALFESKSEYDELMVHVSARSEAPIGLFCKQQ
jgi:hypothetical protein